MKILTRYIAGAFLRNLIFTLLALVALVWVANFLGGLDRVLSGWPAFLEFMQSSAKALPDIVGRLLPISVLLAALFAFNGLSRSAELTAMKSAGMGRVHLLWPLLLVLVPAAGMAYWNQHYLHDMLRPGERATGILAAERHQWRILGDSLYYIDRIDPRENTLYDVQGFHWRFDPFRVRAFEEYRQGTREKDGWRFQDTSRRRHAGGRWFVERRAELKVPDGQFPDVFRPAELDARHTPIVQLYRDIGDLQRQGRRVALYLVEWYQKPAALFALIVMALIGVSLTQAASRRGKGGMETVLTMLAGVVFWLLTEIFLAMGKGEYISPLLAAWVPNATFFSLSLIAYLRMP